MRLYWELWDVEVVSTPSKITEIIVLDTPINPKKILGWRSNIDQNRFHELVPSCLYDVSFQVPTTSFVSIPLSTCWPVHPGAIWSYSFFCWVYIFFQIKPNQFEAVFGEWKSFWSKVQERKNVIRLWPPTTNKQTKINQYLNLLNLAGIFYRTQYFRQCN